jgi:hypothetical protein
MGHGVVACLAGIRSVYETKRKGDFFSDLHVRREIPQPLNGAEVKLDELMRVIGPRATWLDGIASQGVAGLVAHGFAVRLLSSIELYGTIGVGGAITTFGVHNTRVNNIGVADVGALRAFAAEKRLLLVHWCSVTKLSPRDGEFESLFVV